MSINHENPLDSLPFPLWQIDARASVKIVRELHSQRGPDPDTYINYNPDLIDEILDSVLVESVNEAAIALFEGRTPHDLIGPVRYMFSQAPAAPKRTLLSRLAGHRCHRDEFEICSLNGRTHKVSFFITLPDSARPEDKAYAMMLSTIPRHGDEVGKRIAGGVAGSTAQESFATLLSSFAHDLKQPLAAIITSAETGQTWLRRSPPDVGRALIQTNRIIASAHRATQLVDGFRTNVLPQATSTLWDIEPGDGTALDIRGDD